jgi:hypothetical protein
MWKNVNNGVATQPESAGQQAPKPMAAPGKSLNESLVGLQEPVGENGDRPPTTATTTTMATYAEAVNEFTKNATSCIGFLPLISKARDGYEQATKASAELRKVLDSGEENLRIVMTQLEQAISVHVLKSAAESKKPEAAKIESIRGTNKAS